MKTNRPLFGYMKGTITIVGDILSPDPEPWHSEMGIASCDGNGKPIDDTAITAETDDEIN
jgi:hypothetical protein